MADNTFDLSGRVEGVRDPQPPVLPVHFELEEIRQHFDESMEGIQRQEDTARMLLESDQIEACQDIWRSEFVFLESILDFFLHEISKYALYQMFTGNWGKSEKYYMIRVPMRDVENAYSDLSSKEWFFAFLNQSMGREVYLSADSMREQLNKIGIPFNDVMVRAFSQSSSTDPVQAGRAKVKEMFERRNKIAHQNDRDHASADRTEITYETVQAYKEHIVGIVDAVYHIAANKS